MEMVKIQSSDTYGPRVDIEYISSLFFPLYIHPHKLYSFMEQNALE